MIVCRSSKSIIGSKLLGNFISRSYSQITSVPFVINKKDVDRILTESESFLEKTPEDMTDLPVSKRVDPIQKKYLPFHSVAVLGLHSKFSGKYGIDRTEWYTDLTVIHSHLTPQLRARIVTDWYNIGGSIEPADYPLGVHETQIYAGFEYPREPVENALRMSDLSELKQIDPNGIKVSPHEMNMSFALEKIISALHKFEEERIKKHIKQKTGADNVELSNVDLMLESCDIKLHSFHLPAYIFTHNKPDDNSDVLYKVINGVTGKYNGEIIYSRMKTGTFGGVLGFTLGGLSLIFRMNPYITIGTILFRLGLFSGIGGLFSGLWAKYIHGIKYSIARENIKNENEYNKKTTESDEDIKRKGRNQYSNTGNTQNYSNKSFFDLEDECRLLGLNHRNVITLGDLKHAQIEKLRQWHPDVTKENKNLATEMCARINEAHEKISNRIKS